MFQNIAREMSKFLLILIQAILFAVILVASYGKLQHDRYYQTIEKVQNTQINLSISMLNFAKISKFTKNKITEVEFAEAFGPISSYTPIKIYRNDILIFEQIGHPRNPVLKENHLAHEIGDLKFIFGLHGTPPWFLDGSSSIGIGSGARFWKWVLYPKNWFSSYYDYIYIPFIIYLIIFITFRYGYVRLLGLGERVEKQKREKLEFCLASGETKLVEYKETLSLDIQTKTKEKYIEESALKTICAFMNTAGGTLIIGVKDNGDVIGTDHEIDKFHKSPDKFLLHLKNLIKHKIGEQCYPLIDYELRVFQNAKLLLINCEKSNKEIFMNGQEFYVRTNPATDRLEGKKMLEYCREHFG